MTDTIAILLTAHNRKDQTMHCLETVKNQKITLSVYWIFLVDDGSGDGLNEAVREKFPEIILIAGNGNLYWNGGMRLAFESAQQREFDYYLWLNNDTLLYPEALERLQYTSEIMGEEAIVVGSTCDPETGSHTYGGVWRPHRWRRTHYEPIMPGKEAKKAETFNGNCVLIPAPVAKKVGNLDPGYTHGMGDFDYGHRAWQEGCSVWVAAGYYGTCVRNPVQGTWRDHSLPVIKRWRQACSPKGLPPKEWARFTRKYAGWLWPLYWISPYVRMLLPE